MTPFYPAIHIIYTFGHLLLVLFFVYLQFLANNTETEKLMKQVSYQLASPKFFCAHCV